MSVENSRTGLGTRPPLRFLRARTGVLGVSVAASGITAAILTAGSHQAVASYALAAFQTAAVAWLAVLSWTPERTWARVGVIAAAAWTLTFVISSWAYAADPSLLDIGPPNHAIATVDLSLVCFIAGYLVVLRRQQGAPDVASGPARIAPYVRVRGARLSTPWALVWIAIGCGGFAAIFAVTGGPINFLRHASEEGSLTRGRTYFIAAALALVFVVQVAAAVQWANGRKLSRWQASAIVAVLLATATLSSRLLLAVPLVELVFYHALVRRRVRVRVGLPILLGGVFVIVFALGIFKLYGNYLQRNPHSHVGRLEYMFTTGPSDFVRSYSNVSADGVRITALSESIVPRYAAPEYGKEAVRLLLQPIPSGIRPTISTAPAIKAAIYPSTVTSYAQPLEVVGYLQFLFPGLIILSLLLGAAAAAIDNALLSSDVYRPSTLLLLVALATQVLAVIRDASANAIAVGLIEVVGLWVVARTIERLNSDPSTQPETNDYEAATAR